MIIKEQTKTVSQKSDFKKSCYVILILRQTLNFEVPHVFSIGVAESQCTNKNSCEYVVEEDREQK